MHHLCDIYACVCCCCCTVLSDSLKPHGVQHARPPCPLPSPKVCPSSYPLHQWCHSAISSSDTLFFFSPQSFPASETFPMSQQLASEGQNTGASASASGLPTLSIQSWIPLKLIRLISLLSKTFRSLLWHYSLKALILWCSVLFTDSPALTTIRDHWEDQSLDYTDPCRQSMSLLFSTLSVFARASRQEAIVFWSHGCSHHSQWF